MQDNLIETTDMEKVNDANFLFRCLTVSEIDKVKKIASNDPKYTLDLLEPIKQVLAEREDVKYIYDSCLQSKGPVNDEKEFKKIDKEARDEAIYRTIVKEEKMNRVVEFNNPKVMTKKDLRKAGFSSALILCLVAQLAIMCLLIGILTVLK